MVIQQYQDPQVGKYLRYGYWYSSHKEKIKKIFSSSLLVLTIIIWSLAGYQTYVYFSSSSINEIGAEIIRARADWPALHASTAPLPPVLGQTYVLPRGGSLADFLVIAQNPNPKWSLTVDYSFVWDAGQTTSRAVTILPGTTRVLAVFGVSVNPPVGNAQLNYKVTAKQRIKNPQILQFLAGIVDSVKLDSSQLRNFGNSTLASVAIANKSIYNILDPKFIIILKSPAGPLSAGLVSADVIKTGGQVNLEYRWLEVLPANLAVEAYPDFDWLDLTSYRLESGEELRF